jgi:hypothetical protein
VTDNPHYPKELRAWVAKALALATSAELVEELHSRISAHPPTEGTING